MDIPGALQSSEVRTALIGLQEKENIYIRTADPAKLVDLPMGEGYSDGYIGNLAQVLETIAEQYHDARATSALAASLYNPDSELASWLADQKGAAPRLLRMLAHDPPITSGNAAYVLATMIERDREAGQQGVRSYTVLDHATRTEVLNAIRNALADPNAYKRDWVMRALGKAGDASDIPRLEHIAETDSNFDSASGRYLQREHARKAIELIRTRIGKEKQ